MRIRTITYSRIRNLGNYQNEKLEATADIPIGDDPVEARKKLKCWVLRQLKIKKYRRGTCGAHGPVCVCDECM